MKRVILFRHGKAERPAGIRDHARPLAPSGARDVAQAVRALTSAGFRPDLAIVSDALRTRQTFEAAAAAFQPPPAIEIEELLYEASLDTILSLIRSAPHHKACLLMVGHNPGLAETARSLATEGEADDLARLRTRFPTSACAVLSFAVESWAAVKAGRLEALLWVDPSGTAE